MSWNKKQANAMGLVSSLHVSQVFIFEGSHRSLTWKCQETEETLQQSDSISSDFTLLSDLPVSSPSQETRQGKIVRPLTASCKVTEIWGQKYLARPNLDMFSMRISLAGDHVTC